MRDEVTGRHGGTGLGASARQLRAMFSQAAVGIAIVDERGRVLDANDKACAMLGYGADELRGKTVLELTHPDDVERTREQIARLIQHEVTSYTIEKRYVRRDGSATWSNTTVTLLRGLPGQGHQFFGILQPLDDRRQNEEMRNRLAAVVNSSDDAIITKTLDGIITTWNPAAERMYGYRADEAIGRPVMMLIPEDHAEEEPAILQRLRRGEHVDHYETVRRRRDGTLIHVSLSVSPLRDGTGRVIGASKIARDITRQKQHEAALRDADRRKDEFLATLAHELRNPLAPIRQAAALAGAPGASEEQKRWGHEVIARQVRHMSALLDDLLDIARITRGSFDLRPASTTLGAIVDAALETARPTIEARRHSLRVDLEHREAELVGDPLRLSQVLSNLLTNAAKYTDPGGNIAVRGNAGDTQVELAVIDDGIGIAPEMLPEVFGMFTQVKSARARSDGGLGIGLALARGLAELHGGSIEARSEGPGRGSEFIVRIPRRLPDASTQAETPAAPAADSASRTVLIADDNEDAAQTLAMLLEVFGHRVAVAHDGEQALRCFEQMRPEFALLDIGMPGMDGYEVARRIRALGRPVTLVALTGWGQATDKARAMQAGFDRHFTKPVDPDRIVELLATH
ncbi:MAG: PAS domain S-box protein [Pseudomonadota bacterium]|jgi:PAS domain S-box-containing protein